MTRARLTASTVALFFLLCLGPPGAATAQVSKGAPITQSGLDERIDIVLREADVREVLASFGHILSGETEIDPEIQGEVTIELHQVRAATALTALCESAGCLWRIEDGRLKVGRDPAAPTGRETAPGRADGPSAALLDEPVDLELKDADLSQTLRAFGSIVGVRVTLAEALEGKVTVQLENTPVRAALDAICRMEGCRWELVEAAEGPVLRFTATR